MNPETHRNRQKAQPGPHVEDDCKKQCSASENKSNHTTVHAHRSSTVGTDTEAATAGLTSNPL